MIHKTHPCFSSCSSSIQYQESLGLVGLVEPGLEHPTIYTGKWFSSPGGQLKGWGLWIHCPTVTRKWLGSPGGQVKAWSLHSNLQGSAPNLGRQFGLILCGIIYLGFEFQFF